MPMHNSLYTVELEHMYSMLIIINGECILDTLKCAFSVPRKTGWKICIRGMKVLSHATLCLVESSTNMLARASRWKALMENMQLSFHYYSKTH